jgi:hypothetical protein
MFLDGEDTVQYIDIFDEAAILDQLATCFMLVSCLAYSLAMEMEVTCFSVTSVTFNRLCYIISLNIELFIINAARTSNLAFLMFS